MRIFNQDDIRFVRYQGLICLKNVLTIFIPIMALCVVLIPVRARASAFLVKKGYGDQDLSEYETCLTLTAQDITYDGGVPSERISFGSNRHTVFLGDRWQLCWTQGCSIKSLVDYAGIKDTSTIESVNIGNRMTFTGEEIIDGSDRLDYIQAAPAMYCDAEGSLKMDDTGDDVSIWYPEELVLFYEADDVPIGGSMDAYNDSSVIGRKWGEFARKTATLSLVEECLDKGFTLFYGQHDPFDVNRPIEGVHIMYITLKGSGTSGVDAAGEKNSSGGKDKDSLTGPGKKKANTKKPRLKKKTKAKKSNSKNTGTKNTGTKNTKSKKKTSSKETPVVVKRTTIVERKTVISPERTDSPAAAFTASKNDTAGKVKDKAAGTKDQTSKGKENRTKGQAGKAENEEKEEMNPAAEETAPQNGIRAYARKDQSNMVDTKTSMTEPETDPSVLLLTLLCILAGAAYSIISFRKQLKGVTL